MAKTLAERLKAALSANARAADVSTLIDAVRAELAVAKVELAQHHALAVDCGSDEATADDAADAEHRTSRRITRLEGQIGQLEGRLIEINENEKRRERDEWRATVLAERDALAADLKTEWPLIEAKIQHLLWRISLSDRQCAQTGIASAEAVARGCDGNFYQAGAPVHRFTQLKLASLDASNQFGAWPPRTSEFDWAMIDKATGERMIAETGDRVRALEAKLSTLDAIIHAPRPPL